MGSTFFSMAKRRRVDSSKKVSTSLSMEKRRRANSSKKTSDRISMLPHESINSNDRISLLPDELLTSILSHLTFKEATATSLLSHRWRYVWTFTPKLQFDGIHSLLKVDVRDKNRELVLNKERSKYIRWVNNVIALHKNSTIEEFDIFFNLNNSYRKWIDRWLRYAFARKVQRLSLNLTNDASWDCPAYDPYTFPYHLVHHRNKGSVSNTSAKSRSLKGCGSSGFKLLKSISLNNVNVKGETLEFFLSNCPLLEDMSVSESEKLSSLMVIKPSSQFKRLEISYCDNLCSVKICDANLVYLKYEGKRIPFVLENVPLLVDLYVGGALSFSLVDVILMFSSILSQIETFTLHCFSLSWEATRQFHSRAKMCKLKQLVLIVCDDKSILSLANLTSALPCLQRLVLVVSHSVRKKMKRKLEDVERCYAQLKEVEFVGYTGAASDLELIMHLVNNAAALEKIVVDPCSPRKSRFDHLSFLTSPRFRDGVIKRAKDARTRAQKQLINVIPAKIKLEILPIMSEFRSDIF